MPWWPGRSGGPATMCEKTGPRNNHACRIRRAMGDNIHQAGWFITTKTDEDGRMSYAEPQHPVGRLSERG